jgi:hypothetical protein
VLPKAIAVAGLSAIAIAAGGCSGDSDPEAEFRAAFEKKFSAAPWYHHITGIEVKDTALDVTTDLGPESAWDGEGEWSGTSGVICRAAYGVAIETGAIDGGEGVGVMGRDGVGLGGCA